MKRHRQQKGSIHQDKKIWYVRYFVDRVVDGELRHVRIAKQLGEVTTRGKKPPREILEKARAIVAAATVNNANPEKVLTLGDFFQSVYLPHVTQFKSRSTLKGYRDIWKNHVRPRAADVWLTDVRCFHLQRWLDSIGEPGTLGRSALRNVKAFLSAVLKLAKQQGYYMGENPVRDTAVPKAAAPEETYAYDLDEIQSMLAVLPERAAAVVAVSAFAGLRRGELAGTLWENYRGGHIHVTRSVWEGHVGEPKTARSKAAVPVTQQLHLRLDLWRLHCGSPESGPMFANTMVKPLNLNNLLRREILPVLDRCGHCRKSRDAHYKAGHEFERDKSLPKWHGWHAFWRGLGSNLYALGVHDEKTIQRILRHADVSTTSKYYIKTTDGQAQKAMAKLEKALPKTLAVN
jgi:integrase